MKAAVDLGRRSTSDEDTSTSAPTTGAMCSAEEPEPEINDFGATAADDDAAAAAAAAEVEDEAEEDCGPFDCGSLVVVEPTRTEADDCMKGEDSECVTLVVAKCLNMFVTVALQSIKSASWSAPSAARA